MRRAHDHRHGHGEPTPGILFALAAFALLFAGVFGWGFISALIEGGGVDDWKTTTGLITRSLVETDTVAGDRTHRIDIAYSYTVDGVPYTSDRIRFGFTTSTNRFSDAARAKNRYPAGKEVEVTYDPDDPSRAVLETSFTWGDHATGVGVMVVGTGLAIAFGVWGVKLLGKGKSTEGDAPASAA